MSSPPQSSSAASASSAASTATSASSKPFKLQCIYYPSRSRHIFHSLSSSLSLRAFQSLIHEQFKDLSIDQQSLSIGGVPPRLLNTTLANADEITIGDIGIRAGDTIELRAKEDSSSSSSSSDGMRQGHGVWDSISSIPTSSGSFARRSMPKDNSCLFHAVSLLCSPRQGSPLSVGEMRHLAANLVASAPDVYTTPVLGSPNRLYQEHIMDANTWGGAIELLLFARHFKVRIHAFDPRALREDVYGDDAAEEYTKRCFVIFTGDHYDALVYSPSSSSLSSSSSSSDQVAFNVKDESAWARARDYIQSLHNELVSRGEATKQNAWRHDADVKRSSTKSVEDERERKVRESQSRITTSNASGSEARQSPNVSSLAPSSSSPTHARLPSTNSATTWGCEACTMINSALDARCQVCERANPNYVAPSSSTSVPRSSSFASSLTSSPIASSFSSSSPPTRSSPQHVHVSSGFNCIACTAYHEVVSDRCDVCGSSQLASSSSFSNSSNLSSSRSSSIGDDDVPAPILARESQLIGGDDEDDFPSSGGGVAVQVTPEQRAILVQPWTCPACSSENVPMTVSCSICHSSHPNPVLNTTIAAAAAARAARSSPSSSSSSSSSSSAPAPAGKMAAIREFFKSPPPWVCERCGKSQDSSMLFCCQCKVSNPMLQTRMMVQQQMNQQQPGKRAEDGREEMSKRK